MGGITFGGQDPTAFASSAYVRFTHEPSHPLASDLSSPILEFAIDAWRTIPALVPLKHLLNVLGQLSIFSAALAGRALAPGVKATFGNVKDSTHDDNGEILLVLFNKLILHLDPREK